MAEEYISRKAARDVLSALAIRHFELTDLYRIYIKALEDADALMENAQYKGTHDIVTAWDIVAAPTIIEAEEGEG